MNINRIREIIIEEINRITEAPDDEKKKVDVEKEKIAQQKQDLDQKKFDFQKQQADDSDREADQRDAEKEKEQSQDQDQKAEPEKKPNISFKTQGRFYEEAFPELRNLVLSDGNLVDEDERKYIALAVQAAEGRVDKGFDNFLRKGRAGNIYGKDFNEEDLSKIIKYCRFHDLVR